MAEEGFGICPEERSSGSMARKVTVLSPRTRAAKTSLHHTGIAGSGFKSLDEGEKVTYEVAQGRRGPQAQNVSRVADEPGFWEGTFTVPADVEAAASVLVEHFDPDELYEGMVRARGVT